MKSNFLKQLAAMVLATFAIGGPVLSNAAQSSPTSTQQENKETIPGKETHKLRRDSLPDMIGGVEMMFRGSGGRPPHIHGMFHVKAKTHKRTNK